MTGLLVARNDGDNYGELIIYRLPKDKVISRAPADGGSD